MYLCVGSQYRSISCVTKLRKNFNKNLNEITLEARYSYLVKDVVVNNPEVLTISVTGSYTGSDKG